jgi:hypothetical protein
MSSEFAVSLEGPFNLTVSYDKRILGELSYLLKSKVLYTQLELMLNKVNHDLYSC